jgi:large subunit ribosomal protein L23
MKAERLYTILLSPRISEKATRVGEGDKQIVFNVADIATKLDVKQAVEHIFKVKVRDVNLCNIKGKAKYVRRVLGRRSNIKKAYVSLQPGYDIDFIGQG